jgi:transcriptional regulator with XRE-family HTH domain
MADKVEGIRGEYRKLTPLEIGMIVKLFRHGRDIKRAVLAADSSVSEKTLERVEAGQVVSEDSYRRIARAMGLKEDAFVKEEYVPTPEEALEQQEREQAEFAANHTKVAVAPLTDPRQLLALFGCHSNITNDRLVAAEDLELTTEFKEAFRDWSDIAAELPDTERLKAAGSLLDQAHTIERAGYAVYVGETDRYRIGSSRTRMSVVVFFPKPTGSRQELPNEIWLPKRMDMEV